MIKKLSLAFGASVALFGCEATEPTPGYSGVIELEEHLLSFEVAGRVIGLDVERGDAIQKGEVVARLDDTLERALRSGKVKNVEGAEAQVAVLKAGARAAELAALGAEVRAATAEVDRLRRELERQRALAGIGAAPLARVDELEKQLERAEWERRARQDRYVLLQQGARSEEIDGAEAHAGALAADVALSDLRLERYRLEAPIEGLVLDRHAEVGEVVSAGVPIFTVGDPERPYVDVFVPQGQLEGVAVGLAATVRVDATDDAFEGKVEHVERRTEFTPRYIFSERERPSLVVRVRVRIHDPERRLHAGVPAFATFEGSVP